MQQRMSLKLPCLPSQPPAAPRAPRHRRGHRAPRAVGAASTASRVRWSRGRLSWEWAPGEGRPATLLRGAGPFPNAPLFLLAARALRRPCLRPIRALRVWFSSEANFEPSNVASTAIIDRRTPNAELCMSYGSSAMVFDERVFVSFNPFNVYVTQPEVKASPGSRAEKANDAPFARHT